MWTLRFIQYFNNTDNNFSYISVWWLELRPALPRCGSGKLQCACIAAGLGGIWVGMCCRPEGNELLQLSVWKQRWLQMLCLNLLLPSLPDLGGGHGFLLLCGSGRRNLKCSWGLGWAATDVRASAMLLGVGSAGLGQLLTVLWPHCSIYTPNIAPEVQAVCGERWLRCSTGYFTAL